MSLLTPAAIEGTIRHLESTGELVPTCPTCRAEAYPALLAGRPLPMMPRHTPSRGCRSSRRPDGTCSYAHCTCDTCF